MFSEKHDVFRKTRCFHIGAAKTRCFHLKPTNLWVLGSSGMSKCWFSASQSTKAHQPGHIHSNAPNLLPAHDAKCLHGKGGREGPDALEKMPWFWGIPCDFRVFYSQNEEIRYLPRNCNTICRWMVWWLNFLILNLRLCSAVGLFFFV